MTFEEIEVTDSDSTGHGATEAVAKGTAQNHQQDKKKKQFSVQRQPVFLKKSKPLPREQLLFFKLAKVACG
jgi:hypothetical protein